MLARILYILILVIAGLVIPWWLMLGLLIAGIFAFRWFVESVLFGVYIEAVFFAGGVPWLVIILAVTLAIIEAIKSNFMVNEVS